MYAIALVRYRRPLDEVLAVQETHRAYLRRLKAGWRAALHRTAERHTVLVKALLIQATPISRLNVTTVTHLAPMCPPAPK